MESVKIELQNLTKYYYSETAVTQALRNVNLQFRLGEFVAITGESGSGKSTLLKVISGMETFDTGELYVDGEPTFQFDEDDWEEHRRHKIGFVFQDYSLIGHYSAKENIVSALLIMGISQSEAEKKAVEYLERVGLAKQCNQRASKLSSGQKQRLSIARALAKNTDIILADEPTGNLDSETGEQIIKLLQDLSEDHLIIMVTHNYEQVEHYITRKVRLHDGEVILDVTVNNDEGEEKATGVTTESSDGTIADADVERGLQGDSYQRDGMSENWDMTKKEQRKSNRRLARTFAGMNARTQPGKVVLFSIFFLITATVSFLFLGQLFMNADDIFTKEYTGKSYAKQDSTRLSVRRKDGKELTENDIAKMSKASHVVSVDQYDVVNDINYYYIEDEDYKKEYGYYDEFESEEPDEYETGDDWTNNIQFLNKKRFMRSSTSLKESDLVEGKLPVGRNEIVLYDNGKTPLGSMLKLFFTNELLWDDDNNYIYQEMKVVGLLKEKTEQIYFSPDYCQMLQSSSMFGKLWYEYSWDILFREYGGQAELTPIVGEGLTDSQMRTSGKYKPVVRFGAPLRLRDQAGILHVMAYDDNGTRNQVGNPLTYTTLKKLNLHGSFIVEVTENIYNKYIRRESKQASVYITSYAKTDKVVRELSNQGYEAISTLRYGVGDYDGALVQERLKLIAIAMSALLVLLIAEILILRSLMKIRIKDQYVMKFMGMRMKLMCKIGYVEMRRYCVFAIVVIVLVAHALAFRIPMLREMLYYYDIPGYLLYFVYNMVAAMLMVAAFNHLLRGRMDE